MTCCPQDHRPHWPAMAGQLLGNGIWKDLRSKRVPDLTVARRPGLRLNTESSAPISAKSSYGRKTWRCRRATPRRCLQNSPPCIGFVKMLRVCDSRAPSHSAVETPPNGGNKLHHKTSDFWTTFMVLPSYAMSLRLHVRSASAWLCTDMSFVRETQHRTCLQV